MKPTRAWIPLALLLGLGLLAGCNSGKRSSVKPATSTAAPTTSGSTGSTTSGGSTTTPPPAAPPAVAAITTGLPVADARLGTEVTALAMSIENRGPGRVRVSSITLTASGSLDETLLGAARLVRDDDGDGLAGPSEPVLGALAAPAFGQDDGTIAFTSTATLMAGQKLPLIVTLEAPAATAANFGLIGKTLELKVAQVADLVIEDDQQRKITPSSPPSAPPALPLFLHDHLLISEVVVSPNAGEYLELFNPTGRPVDVSNYFITEATDANNGSNAANCYYHRLPTGQNFEIGQGYDFVVKFPAGTFIAPGAFVVVAMDGADFQTHFNRAPEFCLRDPGSTGAVVLETPAGAQPVHATNTQLANGGETVVLFHWDGQSDLVQDIDYVNLATMRDAIDKSNALIDGPDADTAGSSYLPETPEFRQAIAPLALYPTAAYATARVDWTETGEPKTNGNGIGGHDETGEPVDVTFQTAAPTPGAP